MSWASDFPRLTPQNHRVTSLDTPEYNYVAWATVQMRTAWSASRSPRRLPRQESAPGRDDLQLVFPQFDVSRLRLAPNANTLDLHATRPERAT
jgi:hypothetical protein